MKTDKIPVSLSMEELYDKLSKNYDDVKLIKGKIIVLNYSGTKLNITKNPDGYNTKAAIPLSLMILLGVVAGIMVVATQSLGVVPQFVISMVVIAVAGLLIDGLYNKAKERVLRDFCNNLTMLSDSSRKEQ